MGMCYNNKYTLNATQSIFLDLTSIVVREVFFVNLENKDACFHQAVWCSIVINHAVVLVTDVEKREDKVGDMKMLDGKDVIVCWRGKVLNMKWPN